MAVYTKISKDEICIIEDKFNIGKILSFSGIKKGIENTNYLIKTKRKKYILTIFEKRVAYFIKKRFCWSPNNLPKYNFFH